MFLSTSQPFTWANGTTAMLAQLEKGPLTVLVDASNWKDYKSGMFNGYCGGFVNYAAILLAHLSGGLIVRAFWGLYWGDSGSISLSFSNDCGVSTYVMSPNLLWLSSQQLSIFIFLYSFLLFLICWEKYQDWF